MCTLLVLAEYKRIGAETYVDGVRAAILKKVAVLSCKRSKDFV
ncbi:hypothetical protein MIDIC_170050 [Alphaproteobacteria bacterium]